MFDWKLFLILVLVCVPGLLVVVPGALSSTRATARKRLPEGKELPPMRVMLAVTLVQSLVLISGFHAARVGDAAGTTA